MLPFVAGNVACMQRVVLSAEREYPRHRAARAVTNTHRVAGGNDE
jgi:hypothetical protein